MSDAKIRAIIKRPDEAIGHVTNISPSLKNLQSIVDGYIETVTLAPDWTIICNEEGRLRDMDYNCTIAGVDFYGDIIAVGVDGEDLTDLPAYITRQMWSEDYLEMINGLAVNK